MIPATGYAALLILAAMLFARLMMGGIRIERVVFPWAVGIYLIFCAAVFVLIRQMLAFGRCEMLRRGYRQATLIDADRQRVALGGAHRRRQEEGDGERRQPAGQRPAFFAVNVY